MAIVIDEISTYIRNGVKGPDEIRRPFVTLTYAQSLDGGISTRPGERLILSGPDSAILTHELRASHDAILVGINTVIADDPRLTARLVSGKNPQPLVLDTNLRIRVDHKLIKESELPPWIFTSKESSADKAQLLESVGCRIFRTSTTPSGRINLVEVLETLYGLQVKRLMVEGGASVITSFYSAKLVDLVVVTIAPTVLGGFNSIVGAELGAAIHLVNFEAKKLGKDIVVWGTLQSGLD
jgi:riboflavin-specific deaminase-like protein